VSDILSKLLLLFLVLVLMPAIVLAEEETVYAIFGIAPAQQSICVAPGYNRTVSWSFSSTSPLEEVMNVQSDLDWVEVDSSFVAQPAGQTMLITVVAPPKNIQEGRFKGQVLICSNRTTPVQDQLGVQTCLIPMLDISVNRTCAPEPVQEATRWSLLPIIAAVSVLVLSAGIILWRR
jgi:hypothetical protein